MTSPIDDDAGTAISARLAADAALRYAFFDRLPGFVGILRGPDHVYDYVNEAYEAFVGRGDLVGHPVRDRFPDLVGQDFFDMLDRVYATGDPVVLRAMPIRFADEDRFMDLRYDAIRDVRGAIEGIFVSGHDLTDRVRAETRRQVLAELSERLRDLGTPQDIAFVASELLGRTMKVDRAGYGTIDHATALLHVDRDWISPGTRRLPARIPLREYGGLVDALIAGRVVAIDDVAQDARTAGAVGAFAAMRVQALVNVPVIEQGRLVALLYVDSRIPRRWSADDIAFLREFAERTRTAVERSRSDLALRALTISLEEQVGLRTRERDRLWETSEDLLAIADYNGTLLRISPSWNRLLGHPTPALLEGTILRFVHPDEIDAVIASLSRMLETGQPVRYECRLIAHDGTWRQIAWSIVPEPDARRVNAVGRDVTADRAAEAERLVLEEQLRQAQKMEAVGQLTGGIAHDFNNMILGVTGSLQIAMRRLASGRTHEMAPFLTRAKTAADRAAALTHRLLAFSRRQPLDPRAVDVNALVAALQDLFAGTIDERIVLRVVPDDGLWTTMCDPNQLESSLLNLVINARDAMPEGGTLTIETHNADLSAAQLADVPDVPPGRYVCISVHDTGTGMAPATIAKAFDPFFTTKAIGRGTGLGLSMVYGFARQSEGFARIESHVGKGTTITLCLPRHEGPAPPGPVRAEPGQAVRAGRGETILIIEDDAIVRALVSDVLAEHGYRTLQAPDGQTGLALLQSTLAIELLVTDIGLPDLNGTDVVDTARQSRPALPVLFMTGYAEKAAVASGFLRPGMALIAKPFVVEDLVSRVSGMIAR